jgi:uncharacterized membrane protein
MQQPQQASVWFLHHTARIIDRIGMLLPILYVAWGLPLLLVVAIATPPWQNPDEAAQMLRISQIAHGGLFSYRFDHGAGGFADPAIIQSATPMAPVVHRPDQRVTLGMLASAGAAQWGGTAELSFPAIAMYPPTLYVPAVLAVEAGRMLGLSVVHSLIAVRMVNAAVATLIAGFALYFARATRLALAALLVLPMTVAMFASAAQDGLMIALTLLVVGCIDRLIAEQRDPELWEAVIVGVATAAVIMARPPYLPLAALPLICMRRMPRRAWLSVAGIFAVSAVWIGYTLSSVSVPLQSAFDPKAQLLFFLHQPWSFIPIVANTLVVMHSNYLVSFIGVLGWLDTFMTPSYYDIAWYVLLLSFASVTIGPARRTWISLLIWLAAVGAVLFAGYLSWTPSGFDHIEGVQGRYFLPVAAVLAMGVPTVRPVGQVLWRPAVLALAGLAAITPMVIVQALVVRFYLVP